MSNELESARAMVVNLELLEPIMMVFKLVTMRPRPSPQVRRTRSEDHVSGHLIVRFLLASERGLRFRNLGSCGHDLIYLYHHLRSNVT